MEKKEKFLPIGSVVLLKGGTKKAMITGFCSIAAEDKTKMYDYMGCVYPEGYLDFNQICLFDHEQIEEVFHYGYIDSEEEEFKKELKEVASQYENGDEEIKSLIEDFDREEEDDEEEENNLSDDSEESVENDSSSLAEELEYL